MQMYRTDFEQLNLSLRQALEAGDFELACSIDEQRRNLLEVMMQAPEDARSLEVLEYIEACAIENANLCAELEASLGDLSRRSSQSRKMMQAYNS
jgi:hypothetical protein